jgi:hypothetical protein
MPRGFVVGAAAMLAATNPAAAQRVRGIVHDSATGEPVNGAVVSLTDSDGSVLARTIATGDGRFAVVRLPKTAAVHVVRIGFRPADRSLTAADSVVDIRMHPIPASLTAVMTSSRRVCPGQKGEAPALELWEQARSALLAGVVVREANPPRIRVRSFSRTRDPVRRWVTFDSSITKTLTSGRSYVAARPAWAFASDGYMRQSVGGARDYFAPDDEVLLDASFADTHCLRVVPGDRAHVDQIGIGFEPVDDPSRDTLVDVSGVLWMDRDRPALRSLEFEYTNLESMASGSGGEIIFARLSNGAPIIQRWMIHSAIIADDGEFTLNGIRRRPPPRPLRGNVRLLGFQESGGVLISVQWADGKPWHPDWPHVSGVVTDDSGRAVPGARVWMLNTADTVATDREGKFSLPYVPPGIYHVLASDSTLAQEGVARTVDARLSLLAAGEWSVDLHLHSRAEVLPLVCPSKSYRAGTGVLMARVVDAEGHRVVSPHIEVESPEAVTLRDSAVALARPLRRSGEGGYDGRFVICGAALDRPLLLRASKGNDSAETLIDRWKDEVMVITVVLKPRTP